MILKRLFGALALVSALTFSGSAPAQTTDDTAANSNGTYRMTVPTEMLNPSCANANGTGVAGVGVVGKSYGGVLCMQPGAVGAATGSFYPYTLNGDGGVPSHITNQNTNIAAETGGNLAGAKADLDLLSGSLPVTSAQMTALGLSTAALQATTNTDLTNILAKLNAGLTVSVTSSAYSASGVTPISTSLTAAGASGVMPAPLAHRTIHFLIRAGTGVATCYIEEQLDGTNWFYQTVNGSPFGAISYNGTPVNETLIEDQYAVPVRWDCGATYGSFTSGTIPLEITQ